MIGNMVMAHQTAAEAVDDIARTKADEAQNAAEAALSGQAKDDVARAALNAVTTTSWGVEGALADGVTSATAKHNVAVTSFPAGSDGVHGAAFQPGVVSDTGATAGATFDVGMVRADLAGIAGFRQTVEALTSDVSGQGGAQLVVTVPALAAGTHLWVRFAKLARPGGGQICHNLVLADGGARGVVEIDHGAGTVTTSGQHSAWDIAGIAAPTGDDVTITDLGDGYHEVTLRYAVTADVPAGWTAYVSTPSATPDEVLEFTAPEIVANSASATWPGTDATYWTVADATVGGHHTALPVVLTTTTDKPSADGTLVEVVGDNAAATGHFRARVDMVAGALTLVVTENGGGDWLTATLPVPSWGSSAVVLALRIESDEVVLFIDGYGATGLPLDAPPLAITGYAVGAQTDGSAPCALAPTAVTDASGLDVRGEQWRVMTAAERAALPVELPGRIYAEVS